MIFNKLRSDGIPEELWYGAHQPLSLRLLIPVSWLYRIAVATRRLAFASGLLPVRRVAAPVIIVGNISVGGTGKTPLILWLTAFLKTQGFRPGIISRGYGGTGNPQQVRPDSNPKLVGDEPVLLARNTHVPVAVAADRYLAAKELIKHTDCNILLCDDGLQHYSLHRDIEIAVVDGERRFGNGHCLPAGPLREPVSRLKSVDMVVGNGKAGSNQFLMEYQPLQLRSVKNPKLRCDPVSFAGQQVHAVAGLGNPNRFFAMLRGLKIDLIKHVFPDHYPYGPEDLEFGDGLPVLMTEKDAVKCLAFNSDKLWYLPIEVRMPDSFVYRLKTLLKELSDG